MLHKGVFTFSKNIFHPGAVQTDGNAPDGKKPAVRIRFSVSQNSRRNKILK